MGGLGKSSAAARLLERLRVSHKAVVWHGGLDEIELIRVLSDKVKSAGEILNQPGELTLKQRLIELFEQTEPLLLLFDDFEQNAEEKAAAIPRFKPEALQALHAVMLAIHDSGAETRVIVTSRLQVPATAPARWYAETPETLRGADLKKKLRQLEALQESAATDHALREKALELSAGNPRLLEWLNKVLAHPGTDHAAILARLEQRRAKFREEILAEALLEQQPGRVRRILACTTLYRLPVTADGVSALTDIQHSEEKLRRAALVGLVEVGFSGEQAHYYVSSLLHQYLQEELFETERQEALGKAARHLYQKEWKPGTGISEERSLEILRLACAAKEKEIAVDVADTLASAAINQHRYREAEQWCLKALALGEDYRILHTLARAEMVLGQEAAKEHFQKALAPPIDDHAPDEIRSKKAIIKLNHSKLLIRQGQVDEALVVLQDEVLTAFEKLGDVRSRTVTVGKIADILQARGQLDEALRIRQEEELPVYEKLGDVRSLLIGRTKLAILLWQRDGADAADEVNQLLCSALEDARRLRIPEAEVIEGILLQLEMSC